MNNKKQIISLQLPSDLVERLKLDAEENYMNTSAFIRKLLIEYYKEKDNNDKSIDM